MSLKAVGQILDNSAGRAASTVMKAERVNGEGGRITWSQLPSEHDGEPRAVSSHSKRGPPVEVEWPCLP